MSATPLNPLGQLIILSAPSGGGKTTIAGELLRLDPTLRRSISVTTRAKRPDEVEGKDYFFISQAEFDRRLADNELLEHTRIHSNHYATPADYIMQQIQQGNSVLLVIESLGMRQIRLRDDLKPYLTSIFLLPVSMQELHDRLASRPKADPQENRRRLPMILSGGRTSQNSARPTPIYRRMSPR
jgi:guanylate kinase